ncbi:biliverdin-producing heme oxygenase [Hyalangium rubrum]|uniref:Biliverdin-producing heme oxygenase n=1 Tax=Hyalangium rubrum TaxID=3103134 RepID=A0ABU5GVN3_9BACT|nr:biliverdin-producing heme oxygenase [Hyalangium sp. s54d21]MDY7225243.1 biliverdin-producing heme oxygenase [Hyalangium sp. s54d21]
MSGRGHVQSLGPLRLTELLQRTTQEETRAAAGSRFARRLSLGRVDRDGYVRLLSCLQSLYAELEWSLEWNHRHPSVSPFCLPEMWRNELLQDDLRTLLGPSWYERAPRQSAMPWVDRLGLLCDAAPELLAAHAWALYVLDIPGAAAAGAEVARGLGLRGGAGTVFLRHISGLEGTVGRVRILDALDRLSLDTTTRSALLGEARVATGMLRELLAALDRPRLLTLSSREDTTGGAMLDASV